MKIDLYFYMKVHYNKKYLKTKSISLKKILIFREFIKLLEGF